MVSTVIDNPRLLPRSQAVKTLNAWLEAGRFPVGERLPGEEHLADALGVARGTVRQALLHLVAQGRLRKEPNRGHVVVGSEPSAGLLTDAFLLIGEASDGRVAVPGHSQALDVSVLRHVQSLGHHVVHLAPERLDQRVIEELLRDRPRGVIAGFESVLRSANLAPLLTLHAGGIPVAVATEAAAAAALDRVIPDHRGATRQLIDRLVARGRRRILRVWTVEPPTPWLLERNQGYDDGIAAHNLVPVPAVKVLENYRRVEILDHAVFDRRARLFAGHLVDHLRGSQPPDALLTITDSDAITITAACRLCGVDPEKDLDVIGYDGYWAQAWERALEPLAPVFSVDKNNAGIGVALVEAILARQRDPSQPPLLRRLAPEIQVLR